ncbi:cytidine deaminase-like protein [Trichoderma citrinoviride]|uniref:Cytidine deaminase-like protein n=1 Tax=Trichoderma citrinoviride TaxID=58853 RepID=A0A2T4BLW5_9HYPO|nr:cytidine deaminase-like protein [Trichoderma citrinoviride]PTB70314.1 cytidine deaminase-like protein [Trichoderma citrinoviride]
MAAAAVRLMSLAGARRALRRWFRRGWPPGDSSDDGEPEPEDGAAVPPCPPNTPAETSLVEEETEEDSDRAEDDEVPDISDSDNSLGHDDSYDQDFYNDSSTMSLNLFVPTVSGMRQLTSTDAAAAAGEEQQVNKQQQRDSEKQQQIENAKLVSLSTIAPGDDSQLAALADKISNVNLADPASGAASGDEAVAVVQQPSVPGDNNPNVVRFDDPAVVAERAVHLKFIGEALDMAKLALRTNETPVGCVIVHNGEIIARGMNATNVTRNGTRHAEFMAISALLSVARKTGPKTTSLKPTVPPKKPIRGDNSSDISSVEWRSPDEGNEDGSKSHLYPYGQKMISEERVNGAIFRECTLYVTVEPCVMCASLLRQVGIKKVYFGAVNDKFGGTGGVFSIHANSIPISADGQTASAHPQPTPIQHPDGGGSLGVSYPPGGGDGGNIEPGYEIEGGWGRDEAVALLRRFYVQENGRAPVPRKKEGRAARLAAMMEQDGLVLPGSDGTGKPAVVPGVADDKKENVEPSKAQDSLKGKEVTGDAVAEEVSEEATEVATE